MRDVETHLQRVRATSELEQKHWDGSGGGETVMKRDKKELTTVEKAMKSQRFLWPQFEIPKSKEG